MATDNDMIIFTTGAFLKPRKMMVDGKVYFMWIVEEFVYDSFHNGDVCLPVEYASRMEELLEPIGDDRA